MARMPNPQMAPLVDPTGRLTREWVRYFAGFEGIGAETDPADVLALIRPGDNVTITPDGAGVVISAVVPVTVPDSTYNSADNIIANHVFGV